MTDYAKTLTEMEPFIRIECPECGRVDNLDRWYFVIGLPDHIRSRFGIARARARRF